MILFIDVIAFMAFMKLLYDSNLCNYVAVPRRDARRKYKERVMFIW